MASFEEALSQRPKTKKAGPPVLRSIQIEKAENGGHIAQHRFHNNGPGPYHEPESHVFGADEGHKLLAHVAKHLGIKGQAESEGEGEMAEEGEAE